MNFLKSETNMKNRNQYLLMLTLGLLLVGCKPDPKSPGIEYAPQMYHAISYEPFRQEVKDTLHFKDGNAMQLPPENTFARGQWNTFEYNDSTSDKERAGRDLKNPVPLTKEVLEEAEVLFNRYCTVCHGATGKGNGTVPELSNGQFQPPPKYKSRMEYPEGKVFHTLTFGQKNMGSYSYALSQEERWKVVHYVGKLQDELNAVAVADSMATPAADTVKVTKPAKAAKKH